MRFLITCLIVLLTVVVASAQDVPTCVTADDEIFLRDDWANGQITLVSWHSGETLATLENSFAFSSYQFVSWSPDCHYALAGVDGQTLMWDVQLGMRIGSLDAAPTPRVRTHWSPDSSRVVLQTQRGGYLWPMSGAPILLESVVDGYGRSFFSTEWDTQRNELLAVQVSTPNGVTAYDANGQQVGFFHIGDRRGFVEYRRIENNQTIFVYSSNEEHQDNSLPYGLALWSRDDSRQMQMALTSSSVSRTDYLDAVDLSPIVRGEFDLIGGFSSAYFVVNHLGGGAPYLGVWQVGPSERAIDPLIEYHWIDYRQIAGRIDYVNLHSGYLDIADWGWLYNSLRVERISLSAGRTTYESRTFYIDNCLEQISHAREYTDLYEWACQTTPPNRYPRQADYYRDGRVYQNGENNALIWTRR